jgi:hypothetical protein
MSNMRVCDLKPSQRDAAAIEASHRTRGLWPNTPEGSLAHAVWSQLIRDLSKIQSKDWALADLNGTDHHWWLEGFGVGRPFLLNRLHEWSFLGDGKEIPGEANPKAGLGKCSDCKQYKHYSNFAKDLNQSSGIKSICHPCNTIRDRAYRARQKKLKAKGRDI